MEKDLYQGKYRRQTFRLPSWDYRWSGWYFITINARNRRRFFGHIQQGIMCLNAIGTIAYQYWSEIPKHFPNVRLDAFLIMPDHMHGILHVYRRLPAVTMLDPNIAPDDASRRLGYASAALGSNAATPVAGSDRMSVMSPKRGSVSAIIRSYKSECTKTIRKNHSDFGWQELFYDRIIHNASDLQTVRQYILDNPLNWEKNHF